MQISSVMNVILCVKKFWEILLQFVQIYNISAYSDEEWIHIQGDSGGICTTLGNDSMSDSKQKRSYEHWSDFERLRSYDRLKLGIEGNDYWQWTEENNKPA